MAILAEKYATDYKWYVDVILNLIRLAGDYVSEEVWYRVIQIVINREDVQGYAAQTVFEVINTADLSSNMIYDNCWISFQALQAPACHENMVKVGGYILGEFGNLIAGDTRSSPKVQFKLLHTKYHLCSPATRALLLTAYVKFVNLFPEIKPAVQEIFSLDSNLRSADAELQQRASEYLALSKIPSLDVLATVLEEMPPFPEKESCGLLNLLKKKRPGRVPDNPEISGTAKSNSTTAAADTSTSNDNTGKVSLDVNQSSGSADLLGLGFGGGGGGGGGGDSSLNGNGTSEPTDNLSKYIRSESNSIK